MKKLNDITKWVIVALAIGGMIYGFGVIHNEVKHNTEAIQELRQDIKDMHTYLMEQK